MRSGSPQETNNWRISHTWWWVIGRNWIPWSFLYANYWWWSLSGRGRDQSCRRSRGNYNFLWLGIFAKIENSVGHLESKIFTSSCSFGSQLSFEEKTTWIKARSDGTEDLMTSLPNTPAPRKRRNEVPHSLNLSLPQAGLLRQPLNSSDSKYQGTPPSSGDSSGTQMPAFKVAHG